MTASTQVAPVSAWAGSGVVESIADLSGAVGDGRWMDAALSGVGAGVDVAAAVSDPIGELLGAGLGWLLEHLEPLHGWLNDLTGDAGVVSAYCGTWQRLAEQLRWAGDELDRVVDVDLEDMAGDAVDAYRGRAAEMADVCRGLATNASAVATGLNLASTIVQVVHDVVRDALAKVVGAVISWAAELACTAGLAAPMVIEQVSTRVASLATSVGTHVTATLTSSHALRDLLAQLGGAVGALGHGLHAAAAIPNPRALRHTEADLAQAATHATDDAIPPVLTPPMRKPDTRVHVQPGPLPQGRLLTHPSGPPDPTAVPRGRPELPGPKDSEDNIRSLARQDESAHTLAQHGYDVARGPITDGPKNPDFRIEGKIFDNYAPTAAKARAIWAEVGTKVRKGQTQRVILNMDDSPVTMDALREQFRYPIDGLEEVIVVQGGAVIPLFP